MGRMVIAGFLPVTLSGVHLYRKTRSSKVVEEVLGKGPLAGYSVVGRYQGYHRVGCQVQYCYAHLLRDPQDLQVEFAQEKEVEAYAQGMIEGLSQAMRLQSSKPAEDDYYREAARIKKQILAACHQESHHLAIKRRPRLLCRRREASRSLG